MSYTGKYALAKHETLALKCEALERQLEEAREVLAEYIERREKCKTEVCMNSLYDLQEQLKEQG